MPDEFDDGALERLLFPPPPRLSAQPRGLSDWSEINRELKRKGVTLFLLWQEYRERHPQGYQYSHFCQQYRQWQGKQDLVMRLDHRAGEKLFVDYAGHTVPVIDTRTGEIKQAQIFVAVFGATNYTYAEWKQVRVHIDYHVELDGHYYSVPYQFTKQQLDARLTA